MTTEDPAHNAPALTIVPVWALSLIGAVLIGLLAPRTTYLVWLPVALASAVFVTFCIQLSTLQKEGFVNRVMASVGGSLLILAIATAVLGVIAAANG